MRQTLNELSPIRLVAVAALLMSGEGFQAQQVFAKDPLTDDPFRQRAYLKASNTGIVDSFGHTMAMSGDTLVVGAWTEDSAATGVNGDQTDNSAPVSGAAYVFVRDGAGWTQQAYLKASNTEAGDAFGFAVAISGDTIVVGARNEDGSVGGVNGDERDNGAQDSGAAYVFRRNGTTWSQEAYLKAGAPGGGDQFGWSLDISTDTIVVGAWHEDSSATGIGGDQNNDDANDSGATYVFVRNGTSWSERRT